MPVRSRGFTPVSAWRVVAGATALANVRWEQVGHASRKLIPIAPDEILAIDVRRPSIDDPAAIIEPDHGWSMAWFEDLDEIDRHVEWQVPNVVGAIAQGAIAGVPAKVWYRGPGEWYVIVQTAYVAELARRLGWRA